MIAASRWALLMLPLSPVSAATGPVGEDSPIHDIRNYATGDADLWQVQGTGQVRGTAEGLHLDASTGNLELKSRDFFASGTLTLNLGPLLAGRCFAFGLVDAKQANSIFIRQDLPDYEGLTLRVVRHGREIGRRDFGPPVTGMEFTIRFDSESLRIALQQPGDAAPRELLDHTSPQEVLNDPLQLLVIAYNQTQMRLNKLGLAEFAPAPPKGHYVPSAWAPPTPVTAQPSNSPARGDLTTVLANDKVQLKFKSPEKGLGLGSMVFLENGREALAQVDDNTKWWAIEVRRPDGSIVSADNLGAPAGRFIPAAEDDHGGKFIWEQVRIPGDEGSLEVTVTVRLDEGSSFARFRIEVANHLRIAGLWRIIFPQLNHLGYPGESDVMVPTTWSMMNQGELHRGATGTLHWAYAGRASMEYPSGSIPVQHLS